MDFKKMLYDTADQHNYARYQGAIQALKNASQHIQSLVDDNKTPNEIAVSITKHIVNKINTYDALINSTEMGKKMKDLGTK